MKFLAASTLAFAGWAAAAAIPTFSNNTNVTHTTEKLPWQTLHDHIHKFRPNSTVAVASFPEAIRSGLLQHLRNKINVTSANVTNVNVTNATNATNATNTTTTQTHVPTYTPTRTPAPLYDALPPYDGIPPFVPTTAAVSPRQEQSVEPDDSSPKYGVNPGIENWPTHDSLGPVVAPGLEDGPVDTVDVESRIKNWPMHSHGVPVVIPMLDHLVDHTDGVPDWPLHNSGGPVIIPGLEHVVDELKGGGPALVPQGEN
ncbi:hypothetical protein Daus18300_012677 [Diaporthe australafricana]|uniref:Uncharacterized protein n=1 Tax=Diaporthe australafricana TaxID=127596 RepID=A0ABR3W276_9PEZI